MSEGKPPNPAAAHERFPRATVHSSGGPLSRFFALPGTRFWWLTALCALVAITLTATAFRGRGPVITVRFQQGYGIKPGDALRHRGIEVGSVVSVNLNEELDRVDVRISLHPDATGLAREGSRFWIERPRVSLSRVAGLETVVGAKYVGVQPGPADAPKATIFEGVESPLSLFGSDVNITIRFSDGHGLVVGDAVKYLGMVVGEVTAIALNEEAARVVVGVRLVESARRLARRGTQFWVERPKVSLTGVRGLETLVGGRFIALLPGPTSAETLTSFEGLDHAPAITQRAEGGLEIVLEGPYRHGIERGAPLTYRGLTVGHIVSVGLSTDSIAIEARVYVDPAYRRLIREDTQFWSTSGFGLHVGLTGVQLDAETLATIAAGGVALATPDTPGADVGTGHRFHLHEKPDDEWLTWRPRIPVGSSLLPGGLSRPQPLRASVSWTAKRLGLRRQRQRHGWVLPLNNGQLYGPADLLTPIEEAIDGVVTLEVVGRRISVVADKCTRLGALATLELSQPVVPPHKQWPTSRMRRPERPEDCLLVAGAQDSHLPVSIGQLSSTEIGWAVDPSMPITEDWHGASVLSLQDGSLIGVLLFDDDGNAIVALNHAK